MWDLTMLQAINTAASLGTPDPTSPGSVASSFNIARIYCSIKPDRPEYNRTCVKILDRISKQ